MFVYIHVSYVQVAGCSEVVRICVCVRSHSDSFILAWGGVSSLSSARMHTYLCHCTFLSACACAGVPVSCYQAKCSWVVDHLAGSPWCSCKRFNLASLLSALWRNLGGIFTTFQWGSRSYSLVGRAIHCVGHCLWSWSIFKGEHLLLGHNYVACTAWDAVLHWLPTLE